MWLIGAHNNSKKTFSSTGMMEPSLSPFALEVLINDKVQSVVRGLFPGDDRCFILGTENCEYSIACVNASSELVAFDLFVDGRQVLFFFFLSLPLPCLTRFR
jgi:hypothetical protein